jgi:hypothetical protein
VRDDDYDPLDIRIEEDTYTPWPPWYALAFGGLVIEVGIILLVLSIFSE